MYRVRQTDCRTGWQVVADNGKVWFTTRNPNMAHEVCAEQNAKLEKYWVPGEGRKTRKSGQ